MINLLLDRFFFEGFQLSGQLLGLIAKPVESLR
jgi:hypothetical protein